MLPNVGCASYYHFDSGKNYFFKALGIGHCVECESMLENEWRHNIAIASDPRQKKKHDANCVFDFH